jgi:predicted nucleotidyltransferase
VLYAALVGSSTQPDPAIIPRDLDLLVRFEPGWEGAFDRYFGLKQDLEVVSGTSVDLIEIDAVRNPYLRDEFERTQVVLYEAT